MLTQTKVKSRSPVIFSSRALLRPRAVRGKKALASSAAYVGVVVNQRCIPIPKQALSAAASLLREATGGYVNSEDCASAVAFVLAAMEGHGLVSFSHSGTDTPIPNTEAAA